MHIKQFTISLLMIAAISIMSACTSAQAEQSRQGGNTSPSPFLVISFDFKRG